MEKEEKRRRRRPLPQLPFAIVSPSLDEKRKRGEENTLGRALLTICLLDEAAKPEEGGKKKETLFPLPSKSLSSPVDEGKGKKSSPPPSPFCLGGGRGKKGSTTPFLSHNLFLFRRREHSLRRRRSLPPLRSAVPYQHVAEPVEKNFPRFCIDSS